MKQKMLKLLKFLKNHIFSLISLILVIIYVIVGFVSLNNNKCNNFNNNIKVLSIVKRLNTSTTENMDNIDIRYAELDISNSFSTNWLDNSFGYDLFSLNNDTQFAYGYVLNYLNVVTANKFKSIYNNTNLFKPFEIHYKFDSNNYLDLVLSPSILVTSNYYTDETGRGYDSSFSYYDNDLKCWLPNLNQMACTGDNLTINLKCFIYVNEFNYKFDNAYLKSLFDKCILNNFEINLDYVDYKYYSGEDSNTIKSGHNFWYHNTSYQNMGIDRPKELSSHTGYQLLNINIPLISSSFVATESVNDMQSYVRPLRSSDKYICYNNALLNSLKHFKITFKYHYDLFNCDSFNQLLNDNNNLKAKNSELIAGQQAPQQITDLFIQVLETPYNIIKKGLNFQIFGINFGSVLIGLVSILLGVFVIKKLV